MFGVLRWPDRFEHDGAVEGYATITGIWSGDQFRAIHQTTPENSAALGISAMPAPGRRLAAPALGTW
jgi:hypothetical protein